MLPAPTLPIRTERLLLRAARKDDAAAVTSYLTDPEVCRYLLHDPLTAEECAARVAEWADDVAPQEDGDRLVLIVELDGRQVGHVMLLLKGPQPSVAELGWVLHPAAAGAGYATEAARTLLDLGFAHFGCHRVFAHLDGRNDASARLCERLGMTREAHLREDYWSKGEWTDSLIYAVLRHEWEE